MWALVLVMMLITAQSPLHAAELYLLGGMTQDTQTDGRSYAWQIEYSRGVCDPFEVSFSYLNEGHIPGHHRDGYAAQLWAHASPLDRRLALSVGAGAYYYSDTIDGSVAGTLRNDHGVAAMLSMAATWPTDSQWLLRLQANLVEGSSIDTASFVAGVGYQLDPTPHPAAAAPAGLETRNEVSIFGGESLVNTADSEGGVAASVEYRRRVWSPVDVTFAWLYEQPSRENGQTSYRRNSLLTEVWATREFANERIGVGAGAGPLVVVDHGNSPQDSDDRWLSAVITLTASYRILPHWNARVAWHRIMTNYSQDADVILAGVGYGF